MTDKTVMFGPMAVPPWQMRTELPLKGFHITFYLDQFNEWKEEILRHTTPMFLEPQRMLFQMKKGDPNGK